MAENATQILEARIEVNKAILSLLLADWANRTNPNEGIDDLHKDLQKNLVMHLGELARQKDPENSEFEQILDHALFEMVHQAKKWQAAIPTRQTAARPDQ